MGRHASADQRRRVAAWPIVSAVVVVLVVAATVGYLLVVNRDKNTAACSASTVLPVAAAPGAAPAVTAAATAFNATKPVARSTCVTVSVSTVDGTSAATSLAAGWKDQSSPAPGLWVADSVADVRALDAANSAMTAGHATTPLATSPVVLAVRTRPAGAISWSGVAGGAADGLRLALPDPKSNRASRDALESMVAGASTGVVDPAAVRAANPVLTSLASATPNPPATTRLALTALADGTADFTAVPAVESDLATFNATATSPLTAVYPTGRTAGDEILPIPLAAGWVSSAMSDAAAAFDAYLGDKGLGTFAAAHLRTGSVPASGKGLDPAAQVVPLAAAGPAGQQALITAWATAAGSADAPNSASRATTAPSGTAQSGAAPPGTASPGTAPSNTASSAGPVLTPQPTAGSAGSPAPATAAGSTASQPTISVSSTSQVATTPAAVAPGPAVIFVLDTSGSMRTVVDGQSRLSWMQTAVKTTVQQRTDDQFGLWSFSTSTNTNGYAQLVPVGGLAQPVEGTARVTAMTGAVDQLQPGGNSWTYGAIRAAFSTAAGSAEPGRRTKVVVVTDGADSTPNLSRSTLTATVAAVAAQNPSVELDIIGLSDRVNASAMTQIAAAGRGTYLPVTSLGALHPAIDRLAAG